MLQVASAEEKSIANIKDNIDKFNDANRNPRRSNELIGAIDEKVKANENQNENDAQTTAMDFKNLKVLSMKINEVKLPYHIGDLEKGNFANDAINNIKDSQFPSKVGGSKVPRSETVCNSSSSSSPSCLKAKYCKSTIYSKATFCTQSGRESKDPLRANAGPDQVVKSGQTVTLNGREKFDMDGQRDDYSFTWVQLFPRRPVIELSDKDILSPTFMAPKVSHNTAFVFGLSVKKDGSEHKDQVKISVIKSDDFSPLTGENVPKKITSSQDKQHDQLDIELNHNAGISEEIIGEEKIVRNQESTSGPLQRYNHTFTDSADLAEVQKEDFTLQKLRIVSACHALRIGLLF